MNNTMGNAPGVHGNRSSRAGDTKRKHALAVTALVGTLGVSGVPTESDAAPLPIRKEVRNGVLNLTNMPDKGATTSTEAAVEHRKARVSVSDGVCDGSDCTFSVIGTTVSTVIVEIPGQTPIIATVNSNGSAFTFSYPPVASITPTEVIFTIDGKSTIKKSVELLPEVPTSYVLHVPPVQSVNAFTAGLEILDLRSGIADIRATLVRGGKEPKAYPVGMNGEGGKYSLERTSLGRGDYTLQVDITRKDGTMVRMTEGVTVVQDASIYTVEAPALVESGGVLTITLSGTAYQGGITEATVDGVGASLSGNTLQMYLDPMKYSAGTHTLEVSTTLADGKVVPSDVTVQVLTAEGDIVVGPIYPLEQEFAFDASGVDRIGTEDASGQFLPDTIDIDGIAYNVVPHYENGKIYVRIGNPIDPTTAMMNASGPSRISFLTSQLNSDGTNKKILPIEGNLPSLPGTESYTPYRAGVSSHKTEGGVVLFEGNLRDIPPASQESISLAINGQTLQPSEYTVTADGGYSLQVSEKDRRLVDGTNILEASRKDDGEGNPGMNAEVVQLDRLNISNIFCDEVGNGQYRCIVEFNKTDKLQVLVRDNGEPIKGEFNGKKYQFDVRVGEGNQKFIILQVFGEDGEILAEKTVSLQGPEKITDIPASTTLSLPSEGVVGNPLTLSGSITDDQSPPFILLVIDNLAVNVPVVGNSWSYAYTPHAAGAFSVKVSFPDVDSTGKPNGKNAQATGVLTVKNAPEKPNMAPPTLTLMGASVITITEGESFVDPGAVCVENTGKQCNVLVSGSVDTNTPGTYTLYYQGTASNGQSVSMSRQVIVVKKTPTNVAPVATFEGFTTEGSLSANVTGQLTATDANNDPLTFSLKTPPTTGNLIVNPSGTYTLTGKVMPGNYSFTYSVSDGKGGVTDKTASISVRDPLTITPATSPQQEFLDNGGWIDIGVVGHIDVAGDLGRAVVFETGNVSVTSSGDTQGQVPSVSIQNNGDIYVGSVNYHTSRVKVTVPYKVYFEGVLKLDSSISFTITSNS